MAVSADSWWILWWFVPDEFVSRIFCLKAAIESSRLDNNFLVPVDRDKKPLEIRNEYET